MTQTQQVKAHIVKHNSIDPLTALRRYGVFRLAARVKELRNEGFRVLTVMVERRGKRFARYVQG